MKRFSKVSFDDIKTIQVDSGVLLKEFDVENPVFLPENVICATSGGINPVCAPEYYDFGEDVDNAKSAKETKRIRGWNATISFTTLTTSLAAIKLALGAADISGKVLNLRQRLQYAKDFKDIWWVGKRADDKLIAIRLIRSLSDSGFSLQTNKRGKGQINVTLKGYSSFTDIKKVPMEIYVLAEAPTASLYLYGTPSTTGNIGLRNGESVTLYDGAVLPKLPTEILACKYIVIIAYIPTQYMSNNYRVFASNDPMTVGDTKYGDALYYGTHYSTGTKANDPSEWFTPSESDVNSNFVLDGYELMWSNYDIKKGNSVYFAKSADPIPVGEIVDYINDIPIYEVI